MKNETLEFCKGIIKSGVGSSMDTNPVANCNTYEVSCSNCPFGSVGNCGKVKSEHITIAKQYILVNTPRRFKRGDKVINNKLKDGWLDKTQFRLVTDYFVVDNEEVFGSSQSGDVRLILDDVKTGWSDDDLELYKEKEENHYSEKELGDLLSNLNDIKAGETWESVMNKNITVTKNGIDLERLDWTSSMLLSFSTKFKLKRDEVDFVTAWQDFLEGNIKNIESVLTGTKWYPENDGEPGYDYKISTKEMKNKWYINR